MTRYILKYYPNWPNTLASLIASDLLGEDKTPHPNKQKDKSPSEELEEGRKAFQMGKKLKYESDKGASTLHARQRWMAESM